MKQKKDTRNKKAKVKSESQFENKILCFMCIKTKEILEYNREVLLIQIQAQSKEQKEQQNK